MDNPVFALFWISLVGVLAPLLAGLIPRKLVPEVVLLLVGGMLIGPFGLELAHSDEAIDLLHELGLGMLFLLAGFEIDARDITGRVGRSAAVTWVASLITAFCLLELLDVTNLLNSQLAVAIALTSTALGTLLPILKDNGLMKSRVGVHVLRHGAYGELGPVLAIALLLGSRGPVQSAIVLACFAAIAILFAIPSMRVRSGTSKLIHVVRAGAETTAQTSVRLTMLLLVALIAVAAAFDLDIVLAAFAAGFILRFALPEGDEHLESRLEGIAFGLLVPIFFVTSGMAVNPHAITANLGAFAAIVLTILICRGLPVFFSSRRFGPDLLDARDSLAVSFFSATGLPIIVAVTSVAVAADEMTAENASLLVGAGAATVLLYPLAAILLLRNRPADHPGPA
ncbi:cation:proton antiporter [Nocardioides insulae]|uniref:cation:proton antiporter n=1 Tax=Nocardioides insulae TaxID=394734 RepID=UPI0003F65E39|nr:cation:proton antiporter [Nocardioides insulae]